LFRVQTVVGVDFSGARSAGRFIWLATAHVHRRPVLVSLQRCDRLCGTAERGPVLSFLVERIRASQATLWAVDCPFGFPIEVPGGPWSAQFRYLRTWGDDAYGAGLDCLAIARRSGLPQHVKRLTDKEAKAPFDVYHYRIIYQTFFGMRRLIDPLRRDADTALLPFQYAKLPRAARVLVEACPASTLKRLRLPYQRYKQPAGGPLTRARRRNRHRILAGLAPLVQVDPQFRRLIMRDPGGDALDAVIAAAGAWQSFHATDHAAVARHHRYPREGRLYA